MLAEDQLSILVAQLTSQLSSGMVDTADGDIYINFDLAIWRHLESPAAIGPGMIWFPLNWPKAVFGCHIKHG